MPLSVWARRVCLLLLGIGFLTAGYLLWRTWALLLDRSAAGFDVCSAVFGTGCDSGLADRSHWVLGIPLAGWAVVFYAALSALLILARTLGEAFEREALLGALLLSAAGALVGLVFMGLMFAGRTIACPLCLVVHGVNLALVPALKTASGRTTGELLALLRSAGEYVVGRDAGSPREAAWKIVGFANVLLVAGMAYQWVFVQSTLRASAAQSPLDPAQVVAAYESLPRQEVPVDSDDPRLGNADATVQLVVFSSFQCPGCRRFAGELPQLTERFGHHLAVAFKHYPLSTRCNERLTVDRQPQSCEIAFAVEAARRQGKFWPFHNALFASSLTEADAAIEETARNLGLKREAFAADRHAPATADKIAADVALGTRLEIPGTPEVFLNGRAVNPPSVEILEILIEHELKKNAGVVASVAVNGGRRPLRQ